MRRLYNRMGGVLDVIDPTDPATQQAASEITSTVTSFLSSLLKSINIGDNVPGYPVKSMQTMQKILSEVQGNFPEPINIAQAQEQLQRAQQWEQEALKKAPTDSNLTYAQLYRELQARLKAFIANGGVAVATVIDPKTGLPKPLAPPLQAGFDPKILMFVGAGLLLLALANKKKSRR